MKFEIGRLIDICDARTLVQPADDAVAALGLTWDSRTVEPGFVYAAIKGERVDGHDFVQSAIEAGACAALCTVDPGLDARLAAQEAGAAVFIVDDIAQAIADIAHVWRKMLGAKVVAVTGSVGKTTTKGLIRDVLSTEFETWATKGNFNNELGAPYTVLTAPASTEVLVVEMGMDRPGQIAHLAKMAEPEIGIVSIVGTSHLEYLKTRENIALAKSELLDALPAGGKAFLNAACDMSSFMVGHSRLKERGVKVGAFSSEGEPVGDWFDDGAVWAENVSIDDEGRPSFDLCANGEASSGDDIRRARVTLLLRGVQNVSNACGAAGVCLACGMSFDSVAKALSKARPESGRAELLHAASGALVLNDAYNAAPESMRAALATLSSYATPGRRIAILGDMGELGSASAEGHASVGRAAADANLDMLVCVGELSRGIAEAARAAGFAAEKIACVENAAAALDLASGIIGQGDIVLVKASHYMGLDAVVEGIVE